MKRSRTSVLTALALIAALGPAAMAGAAPKGDDASHGARAEHERIVAHWTPERMRAAKPRDFVRQADGSFRQVTAARGANGSKGKPGGGGSTGSAIPSTSGAAWTAGGEVAARTGKVFFRMGGSGYVCSGAVVDDGSTSNTTSLILTAAHCVYDESEPDGVSGFATDWLFIPDFDAQPNLNTSDCTSAETRFGCWTATALVAHDGFTKAGGFTTAATQNDFAFAVVGPGGKGGDQQLDATVGGYELSTSVRAKDQLSAFGYPAAGRYNGTDLTYCSGAVSTDPYNGYTGSDDNWRMSCQMTGGSSGGPWVTTGVGLLGPDGSGGAIGSLNSYGYSGIRSMFGPVFNTRTLAVYSAAKAATRNTSVG